MKVYPDATWLAALRNRFQPAMPNPESDLRWVRHIEDATHGWPAWLQADYMAFLLAEGKRALEAVAVEAAPPVEDDWNLGYDSFVTSR